MQHWDAYWQKTKALNSFAEGEQAQGYTGDIATFWQTVFVSLPDNSSILDLATGNGALAVLALQANDSFIVSASDQANIAPLQLFSSADAVYPLLQKIRFHGNMPSESLTFADQQFDMVISQFGFEYAQTKQSLQQLHRVLKPAGKVVTVVHHAESFITDDCKAGLAALQSFIGPDGLLAKARHFALFCAPLQQRAILSNQQIAALKQQNDVLLSTFMQQQQQFSGDKQDWFNLLAKDVVPLIAQWRKVSAKAIDTLEANMQNFNQRIADQVSAAWSNSDVQDILQLCHEHWHKAEVTSLDINEGKLCWVLKLEK